MTNRIFTRGGEMPIALSKALSSDELTMAQFSSLEKNLQKTLLCTQLPLCTPSMLSSYIDMQERGGNNISYYDIMV